MRLQIFQPYDSERELLSNKSNYHVKLSKCRNSVKILSVSMLYVAFIKSQGFYRVRRRLCHLIALYADVRFSLSVCNETISVLRSDRRWKQVLACCSLGTLDQICIFVYVSLFCNVVTDNDCRVKSFS